jgi:GRAS domain family
MRYLSILELSLIQCSQAIATNEYQRAKGLVKEIRKHSSLDGDGAQRMAHVFVSGLDARLSGSGNNLYNHLIPACSTRDILNAHSLLQSASPFIRASFYFANKAIIEVSAKLPNVHVIDFGIDFGFQWPCLMQALSQMEGGAPKLRITAIDIFRRGFNTAEQIEETGWRLNDYARSFSIPFQYNSILCAKWDSICIEDLSIEQDEVLVVNSLYRFENLGSKTDDTEQSRNKVLDIIRKLRPHVFVHGTINGSFGDPLFVARFKQALFHYSALFDFLDSIVPRENKQRNFIEKVLWAHEAINVIACEGSKRIERPEGYKQWHRRNLAAGFEQLPLNPGTIKRTKDRIRELFNNDFFVEDDNQWLLLGWKGKILYALSTWLPKQT